MSVIFSWNRRMSRTVIFLVWAYFACFVSPELVITRPPKNATVLLNTRHLLHCEASGRPKPRVRWFHNSEEMPRYGINYRVRSSGALRFIEVKVQDRGIYRCQAESGKESLFSDPAHLVVQAEVELIHYVPADGEILIPYNGGTKLTCQAASIPGPQFQWRKNGKSIIDPEADEVRIEQRWHTVDYILTSMLSVRNMTTSAQFECEAVNEHVWGASVKSKKFNVIVLPNSDMSDERTDQSMRTTLYLLIVVRCVLPLSIILGLVLSLVFAQKAGQQT